MKFITYDVPVGHEKFGKSFPCPDCYASEFEQKRITSIVKDGGLSEHHMYTFQDFWNLPKETRDGKENAANALYELATNHQIVIDDELKRGILLYGSYGVGKTTLANSCLIETASRGTAVLRVKLEALVGQVQGAYSAKEGEPDSETILDNACRAKFALFDDIGDPSDTKPLTDDKRRIVHRIFEYRLEHDLPTVITTNIAWDKLSWFFTERTAQRIFEMCHCVKVSGMNLRR